MANIKKDITKKGGLGRGLSELLSDNDELTNIENKVLLHRTDGSSVKIYNQVGGAKDSRRSVKKSEFEASEKPNACKHINNSGEWRSPLLQNTKKSASFSTVEINEETLLTNPQYRLDENVKANANENCERSEIIPPSKRVNIDDRIVIGKSREERRDESEGVFKHGKPYVVPNGASGEPIRIGGRPKPKREEPRIKIGGEKSALFSKSGSVADGLSKLDHYRPNREDEFLADLLEIAEKSSSGDYRTDKNGRIIIEANKSKIKKK